MEDIDGGLHPAVNGQSLDEMRIIIIIIIIINNNNVLVIVLILFFHSFFYFFSLFTNRHSSGYPARHLAL